MNSSLADNDIVNYLAFRRGHFDLDAVIGNIYRSHGKLFAALSGAVTGDDREIDVGKIISINFQLAAFGNLKPTIFFVAGSKREA